ncbi:hypothetical protein [Algisphaera agarilytica]|uniref:hypothetical protein n=1 Tax=Algisphaera agarilytica TaxID=1385975 RepID=UPI001C8824CE|nr:hypothetical protein [Algisphaera agarilytica]
MINTYAPYDVGLFLTGRRSGKSRIAAVIAAYEAVLAGHQKKLAPGEVGVVPVLAPTMKQGRIVKGYLRAIFDLPLLQGELATETAEGFTLHDGTRIEIMAGDYRKVRGYTLLAAIIDEAAFFQYEDTAKVNDTELVRALRPSLATTQGKLIAITSPYARKGWCWYAYRTYHGSHARTCSAALIWQAPSRTMNPTLPQKVVDDALREDYAAAKSEYLAEFRDDVAAYVDRSVVEAATDAGTPERLPRPHTAYTAFADLSGGRNDDAALAIAHKEGERVIIDYARQWRPPHNPTTVIEDMAAELRRYGIRRCTGDNYAAEFVAGAFRANGITYKRAPLPKSGLYMEFLPRLTSGLITLPANPVLAEQLCNLERRTRAGGRDIIDHPPGGHDDLANAVAGVATTAATPARLVGALAI